MTFSSGIASDVNLMQRRENLKPKLCKAGQQLREQFDDCFPDRDRTSDGWIADARHSAAGTSDHIPDPLSGIVRATDTDRDVSGKAKPDLMPDIADQLRRLAKTDKRIKYIIFDGKIASARSLWRWRKYKGINQHRTHLHISFTRKGDQNNSFFNIPLLGGSL
jgi:hypothetical protein